jgi:hypothetical protein
LGADVTFLGEKVNSDNSSPNSEMDLPPLPVSKPERTSKNDKVIKKIDMQGFVLIRNRPKQVQDILEVRLAVCGNVRMNLPALFFLHLVFPFGLQSDFP